ncbi:MAG: peroxiredoxin [Chlamydiia bacterium]|nr:peroxiredoxin [Chlamydiia bacterium]
MGVLVGKAAPGFNTKAVVNKSIVNDFCLEQFQGSNLILFFYPLDFTFVCPTELHAFQDNIQEFKKRNTQIVGCSVDSVFSHLAWLQTPKKKGGIEGVEYPIMSDINKTIARDYDVLSPAEGIAYRGLFLIDRHGIVRHQVVNDLPIGRSIEDTLRVIDALNHFEKHGEVCPANWAVGKKSLSPTQEGLEAYFN